VVGVACTEVVGLEAVALVVDVATTFVVVLWTTRAVAATAARATIATTATIIQPVRRGRCSGVRAGSSAVDSSIGQVSCRPGPNLIQRCGNCHKSSADGSLTAQARPRAHGRARTLPG
jgi:cytochrome c553